MRYIRYLILGLIVAFLVVEGMANRQEVTLTVLPSAIQDLAGWNFSIQLPLFVVILGSIGLGLLLGYLLEWTREGKHRREVDVRRRQVRQLDREVTKLKTEKNQGKDEVLAILDEASTRKAS